MCFYNILIIDNIFRLDLKEKLYIKPVLAGKWTRQENLLSYLLILPYLITIKQGLIYYFLRVHYVVSP